MRKFSGKLAGGVLAFALSVPTFALPAAAEAPVETYKIYPEPQSVVYSDSETTISEGVNLVFSQSVDEFTKEHAKEVFALLGVKTEVTAAKAEGKTNVLVGIKGDDSEAEAYFDEKHSIKAEDLFEKTDAYALAVDHGTISVLGVSSDAAYFGLTSLKHIFNQVQNRLVRDLLIEDYADVKTRGFIEGYYGNPWSVEDRADLMTFGGDYKLNGYIYAPKDDPKHNAKWRELYTDEELEKHRILAEAGNKSKCYYIYALHPMMYNAISFGSSYQSDLQIIKDKFEQLMGVGVRQFAILGDDAGIPGNNPANYVTLMTDLTNWIDEKQKDYPGLKKEMVFCPNDYMGNGSSSQMQALKNLPDSVSIIETGGRVWGEVSPSFNNTFYNNMSRPAFMWINWPCSDNTKDGLIMGGAEAFLKPGVNPDTVDGIVLNPMQQSEPSKEAIFTNADYAWHIWDSAERYDTVWKDSFHYMDHGTGEETEGSLALLELSKHMKNSRQVGNTESEDIKPKIDAFLGKLQSGEPLGEDIAAMKAEFEILRDAAVTYREKTGNERTLSQIHYWIDAFEETANAVLGYLDTIEVIESEGSLSEIWDSYSAAQAERDKSASHSFLYIDHNEYAQPGRMVITPFMNRLDSTLSQKILPMINPGMNLQTFITSRTDTPNGALSNVTDNNASTQIIFQNPNSLSDGDYVGLQMANPIHVDSVIFRLGQSGNLNDTFATAKVQFTKDGKTWEDYGEEYTRPQEVILENLNLDGILGVRMLSTSAKSNTWLGVRDIVINPTAPDPDTLEPVFTLPSGNGWYDVFTLGNIKDGNASTYGWTNQEIKNGDTYTWDFGQSVLINSVHLVIGGGAGDGDKMERYDLQYSVDGSNWTTVKEYNGVAQGQDTDTVDMQGVNARYVRLISRAAKSKWSKIAEFTVDAETGDPYNDKHLITNTESDAGVYFMPQESRLKSENGFTLNPGEYVGIDLGKITTLTSLEKGTTNVNVSLQTSRNGYEWQEANPSDLGTARYVRLVNNTKSPEDVVMDEELVVTSNDITGPYLYDTNITINPSWGVEEDSRNNGAAFDGDLDTTTEFGQVQTKDDYFIYDLGQEWQIYKLAIYCQDSAVNYIRDAKMQISDDLETWTDVFEIGDGIENEDDASLTAVNSDAGYIASSTYPNKVMKAGTLEEPLQARYIRVLYTADNGNRASLFNEIEINDGEYKAIPNPAFTVSQSEAKGFGLSNMLDGDLATSWMPESDAAGSMRYDFSQDLSNNAINVIQRGTPSNARVKARVVKDGEISWVDLGTLSHSLNQFRVDADQMLAIQVDWDDDSKPNISEIITYHSSTELPDLSLLQAALRKADSLDLSRFSEENKEAYAAALARAKGANSLANSQENIDSAAKALNNALLDLRLEPDQQAADAL